MYWMFWKYFRIVVIRILRNHFTIVPIMLAFYFLQVFMIVEVAEIRDLKWQHLMLFFAIFTVDSIALWLLDDYVEKVLEKDFFQTFGKKMLFDYRYHFLYSLQVTVDNVISDRVKLKSSVKYEKKLAGAFGLLVYNVINHKSINFVSDNTKYEILNEFKELFPGVEITCNWSNYYQQKVGRLIYQDKVDDTIRRQAMKIHNYPGVAPEEWKTKFRHMISSACWHGFDTEARLRDYLPKK